MEQNNETFHYTYSAKQQEEIRAIREKYLPKSDGKMIQLRKLDASAERAGTIAALVIGLGGTMLFGTGMYFTIDLEGGYFAPGIVIGLAGLAMMGVAPIIRSIVVRRKREQIAPEVLRLADELEQERGEE